MNNSTFVYTIYIHATTERVWAGLTDPAFTKQYWGVELISDWKPRSSVTWHEGDATISDPEQIVLEADPPHRLAYRWHSFTKDWAATHSFDDALVDRLASEPRSSVRFEVDNAGARLVKLTLVHEFGAADTLRDMCSQTWPRLLSELKTLLETTTARTRT